MTPVLTLGKVGSAYRSATLYGFGANTNATLGNGTNTSVSSSNPAQIGTATNWTKVATNPDQEGNATIGIRNGKLYGWGSNTKWQPAQGTSIGFQSIPSEIYASDGLHSSWVDIAIGNPHCLAVRSNGTLWAWGQGTEGATTFTGTTVEPTQIGSRTDWAKVSAGRYHSFAIRTDGTLWAWGANGNGYLGTGGGSTSTPTQVTGGGDLTTNWTDVSGGHFHSLGIRDGKLYGWGYNHQGQVGDGTTTQRNTPVRIGSESDWTHISAGNDGSLAIRNGELYGFGLNTYGQLGNGGTTSLLSPTRIGTASDWKMVSLRSRTTMAIRGNNAYTFGEGVGTTHVDLGLGSLVAAGYDSHFFQRIV